MRVFLITTYAFFLLYEFLNQICPLKNLNLQVFHTFAQYKNLANFEVIIIVKVFAIKINMHQDYYYNFNSTVNLDINIVLYFFFIKYYSLFNFITNY